MKPNPIPAADIGCFAGLDFGTTGARLIVIDAEGASLFKQHLNFHENTWQEWRSALFQLLGAMPANLRGTTRAIAFCGTSATSLICNDAGVPLLPAVLYNEARNTIALHDTVPANHIAAAPSSSLAKLSWFSKQPEFSQARHFLHQADWLAFLLHGRLGISDYHNALKLGYDVESLHYPDWLLTLPIASLLPQILEPGCAVAEIDSKLAERLGMPKDCVVRAGTTDSIAAFFASGAHEPGQAVTSLGSTLVLKLLSRKRVEAPEHGIYSHRCGNLWLAGGASNCGGAVLEKLFGRDRLKELSDHIDPNQASELDYYPLDGTGERFPIHNPKLQARLEPRPKNDVEYLHGLLESLARIECQGYRLLEKLGATPVSEVLTAGGGASNPAWRIIRERVLAKPVKIASQTDAAMGAALLAARGERLLYSQQHSPISTP